MEPPTASPCRTSVALLSTTLFSRPSELPIHRGTRESTSPSTRCASSTRQQSWGLLGFLAAHRASVLSRAHYTHTGTCLRMFSFPFYLSTYLSTYLPIYLPTYLSIYLSESSISSIPSIYLLIHPSFHRSIYLCVFPQFGQAPQLRGWVVVRLVLVSSARLIILPRRIVVRPPKTKPRHTGGLLFWFGECNYVFLGVIRV